MTELKVLTNLEKLGNEFTGQIEVNHTDGIDDWMEHFYEDINNIENKLKKLNFYYETPKTIIDHLRFSVVSLSKLYSSNDFFKFKDAAEEFIEEYNENISKWLDNELEGHSKLFQFT